MEDMIQHAHTCLMKMTQVERARVHALVRRTVPVLRKGGLHTPPGRYESSQSMNAPVTMRSIEDVLCGRKVMKEGVWTEVFTMMDTLTRAELMSLYTAIVSVTETKTWPPLFRAALGHCDPSVFVRIFLDNGRWMQHLMEVLEEPNVRVRVLKRERSSMDADDARTVQLAAASQVERACEARSTLNARASVAFDTQVCALQARFPNVQVV